MLWAIDVGNTQTVVGIHDGSKWLGDWRIQTDRARTEDEWRSLLWPLCQKEDIPWRADGFMISSVVPRSMRSSPVGQSKISTSPLTSSATVSKSG
ncbi:MAG: type III pantothenate kinase [Fimbriimonadaceae bacterium]